MTQNTTETILLANEDFVSTMENLLDNKAVIEIDVTYYMTGGCNLKASDSETTTKFYISDRPADKIGRFIGEVEWLIQEREDIISTTSKSHGWYNYVLTRKTTSTKDAV